MAVAVAIMNVVYIALVVVVLVLEVGEHIQVLNYYTPTSYANILKLFGAHIPTLDKAFVVARLVLSWVVL